MTSAADLGGRPGFGPVRPSADESPFRRTWEGRVFALTLAMGAARAWNIDMSRWAREDRPSAEYLSLSYYELWLLALERLLVESGLVGPDELDAGTATAPGKDVPVLPASKVATALRRGGPAARIPAGPARFTVGQRVRTSAEPPAGHTRLPGYARGHVGTITAVHGCHVYPDSNAAGAGEDPQWLYSVTFDARELWGPGAEPALEVTIDAFEPYLRAA
jgi:nitrile hydratase